MEPTPNAEAASAHQPQPGASTGVVSLLVVIRGVQCMKRQTIVWW
jgi:hypothetical protein